MELIKKGFEIEELKNYEEVLADVTAKTSKYKDLIVTEENEKEMAELSKELKKDRKEISGFRAKLNKDLKALTKERLDKIDLLKSKYEEVIKPIDETIEAFKEDRRIKRLEAKKKAFSEIVEGFNEALDTFEFGKVEFKEEYANKANDSIAYEIEQQYKKIDGEIKNYKLKKETLKLKAFKLKQEYELGLDLPIETIRNVRDRELSDLIEELEYLANGIKNKELEKQLKEEEEKKKKQQAEEVKEVVNEESGEIEEVKVKARTRRITLKILMDSNNENLLAEIEQLIHENYADVKTKIEEA